MGLGRWMHRLMHMCRLWPFFIQRVKTFIQPVLCHCGPEVRFYEPQGLRSYLCFCSLCRSLTAVFQLYGLYECMRIYIFICVSLFAASQRIKRWENNQMGDVFISEMRGDHHTWSRGTEIKQKKNMDTQWCRQTQMFGLMWNTWKCSSIHLQLFFIINLIFF